MSIKIHMPTYFLKIWHEFQNINTCLKVHINMFRSHVSNFIAVYIFVLYADTYILLFHVYKNLRWIKKKKNMFFSTQIFYLYNMHFKTHIFSFFLFRVTLPFRHYIYYKHKFFKEWFKFIKYKNLVRIFEKLFQGTCVSGY